MAAPAHDRLSFREKLGYGIGDFASATYINFLGYFLLYFYVDLGGLAPAAIGLMLLITKLVDAMTDPMMGAIADRTRTRWGRYRPYLLWGAVPFSICGVLVFATPGISQNGKLVWVYVTYSLAMLAYTVVNVPYSGLLGVISPHSSERTSATAYRMLFYSISGISIGMLATTLVRELGNGDEARGIFLTMCIIGAVSLFCWLITFATTRERIPPTKENAPILRDLAILVRTPAWLIVALAAIMFPLAISSRAASALFYFKYVAKDDGVPVFLFLDRVGLFYTALALGQLGGVFLANMLRNRFEKRDLILAAGAIKLSAIVLFYLLPLDAVWPQTAVQLLVGLGFGMIMVMAYSMFTDVAEYVDWKSGQQMTGLAISASIFAIKAGIAFGAAVPGFTLAYFGFVAGENQSDQANMGIEMAFAIAPALAIIPAGAAVFFYKIDRRTIAQIEADLNKRRAVAN